MQDELKNTEFRKRIRKLRGKRTQAEMATLTNITQGQWSRLENGVIPKIEVLRKIAKALKITIDELTINSPPQGNHSYKDIDPGDLAISEIKFSIHEENSNTPDPLTTEERILLENYRAADSTIQNAARTMLADSAKESGGNGAGGINCTEQKSASK